MVPPTSSVDAASLFPSGTKTHRNKLETNKQDYDLYSVCVCALCVHGMCAWFYYLQVSHGYGYNYIASLDCTRSLMFCPLRFGDLYNTYASKREIESGYIPVPRKSDLGMKLRLSRIRMYV